MLGVLWFKVVVGGYVFRRVAEAEIETSWRTLGDTAKIQLPNLKALLDARAEGGGIKGGQKVEIWIGYLNEDLRGKAPKDIDQRLTEKGTMHLEFEGFVRRIEPNVPLVLECEDYLYQFKRTAIDRAWKNTTLLGIARDLVAEVNRQTKSGITLDEKQVPDSKIEKWRCARVNAAEALDKLKEAYGLFAYLRGKQLYLGLAYLDEKEKRRRAVRYEYGKNIIETDLTYRRKEDVRLQVNAIGILPDNKKIEVKLGDGEGERRDLVFYDIRDKATLTKLAQNTLNSQKMDGYEGGFTTFGLPFAQHSDVADYADPRYADRDGRLVIDRVTVSAGSGGFRRKIKLGLQLPTK